MDTYWSKSGGRITKMDSKNGHFPDQIMKENKIAVQDAYLVDRKHSMKVYLKKQLIEDVKSLQDLHVLEDMWVSDPNFCNHFNFRLTLIR